MTEAEQFEFANQIRNYQQYKEANDMSGSVSFQQAENNQISYDVS